MSHSFIDSLDSELEIPKQELTTTVLVHVSRVKYELQNKILKVIIFSFLDQGQIPACIIMPILTYTFRLFCGLYRHLEQMMPFIWAQCLLTWEWMLSTNYTVFNAECDPACEYLTAVCMLTPLSASLSHTISLHFLVFVLSIHHQISGISPGSGLRRRQSGKKLCYSRLLPSVSLSTSWPSPSLPTETLINTWFDSRDAARREAAHD